MSDADKIVVNELGIEWVEADTLPWSLPLFLGALAAVSVRYNPQPETQSLIAVGFATNIISTLINRYASAKYIAKNGANEVEPCRESVGYSVFSGGISLITTALLCGANLTKDNRLIIPAALLQLATLPINAQAMGCSLCFWDTKTPKAPKAPPSDGAALEQRMI